MSRVKTNQVTDFAGLSHLFSKDDKGLASVLKGMLRREAKRLVRGVNQAPFTDSSAGVAGVTSTGEADDDTFTFTGTAPDFKTGDGPFQIVNTGGGLPTGVTAATDYWIVRVSASAAKIATSKPLALRGSVVNLTTDGTGVQHFQALGGVTIPVDSDLTGLTTGVTSASLNTAADTVMDAYAVIYERLNRVRTALGMGSLDDGPGTVAAAGVIAAIDDTASANTNDTDSATFASARLVVTDLLDAEKTVVRAIDDIRVATGLARMPRSDAYGNQGTELVDGDLQTAIENAADGADATSTLLLTEWNALVDNLADNVALMADQVDELTGANRAAPEEVILGPVVFNQTDFAAGTDGALVSPVSGRVRGITSQVVDEITAGEQTVTLDVNGTTVTGASLTIATGAIIGALDEDAVADGATTVVAPGDTINVLITATPTAGAALVYVHVEPTNEGGDDLASHYVAER